MKRIAIDIDEVLTPMVDTMMKWRRPRVPPGKKYPYLFRNIWNISEKESQKMLREFYDSKEFAQLPVLEYSLEAMKILKDRGTELYILTGRQHVVREKTQSWIEENFPGVFRDVILTNSFTPMEVTKAEFCKSLALDTIIDDNYEVCLDCMSSGKRALNFIGDPVYPWCYETGISVKSWRHFCDTLPETPETFSELNAKTFDCLDFPI